MLTTLGTRRVYNVDDFAAPGASDGTIHEATAQALSPPKAPSKDELKSARRAVKKAKAGSFESGAQRIPHVHLCKFQHVEGAQVCHSLYEHYQLPDGTLVHYYVQDDVQEKVLVSAGQPPVSCCGRVLTTSFGRHWW